MAYTTINKSTDYFNTVLYTGTEPSNKAVTGVGFKPDFTWIKQRSGTEGHYLADIIRGSTYVIRSNESAVENNRGSNGIQSFDSDGFTAGGGDDINSSGGTFASWNWLAGGSQGSSNTDGSINTTYTSVNTTAGFSISSYTGTGSNATVGHGLGVAPKVILIKVLNEGSSWGVYHDSIGNGKYLRLNSTTEGTTSSSYWNSTSPTSSVFSLGSEGNVNQSAKNFISYAFAEKTGYSKFGSYTGNGNADGTFVYTGFKPSFLMVKRTDTADTWIMYDNKRIGYNPNNYFLQANSTAAESSSDRFDLLSNGFKPRYDWTPINASGGTYIYMAFGQSIVGSNNIPATAR